MGKGGSRSEISFGFTGRADLQPESNRLLDSRLSNALVLARPDHCIR